VAETAPIVRADRDWGNEVELYVQGQVLYRLADMINAATRAGAIYGQIILPPDEAARKQAAMNRGQ
jgi:hypothetical protein